MTVGGITSFTSLLASSAPSTALTGSTDKTASADAATDSGTAKTISSQLATPDLFLKLLMAELEHEDPTNPTTPSSILQQTAELSQVESITTMTTSLNQQRRFTEAGDATGLIGKQVLAVVTGEELTGTVSGVALTTSGTPFLLIGNTYVPLDSVVEVTDPSTTKPITTTPTKTKTTTTKTATKTTTTKTTTTTTATKTTTTATKTTTTTGTTKTTTTA